MAEEQQTIQQVTSETNAATVASITPSYSTDNKQGLGVIGTAAEMWMQEPLIGAAAR